mmetsp:Transcript_3063/g.4220  ORF Transcript_3063/g.4220 Transcript_3063/m.4220 type:complete len:298 (-) Transcript_3063:85-978(-)|eukprot:CAMPEP_0194040210 /NCGR_PEP_ID=MMETSP0009_2-20130614/12263_1 /TAXON_ID=210454 /ORGANISM="Grammatophora oceanica, Strain CCMP 410" /LENGTH=297 /DNA_ID=CAMNT_0038683291 /DNA_START=161 /DNA_END=1054 /DNA_ORIENTATION=+
MNDNKNNEKTALIAGATGYAGRYMVEEFESRNYTVKALVRKDPSPPFPSNVQIVRGDVTKPETLKGLFDGVDVVVSSVGITRQRDGVTYRDVDYEANKNLLEEALEAKVSQFGYVHVIHGDILADVSVGVAAKQAFVDKLQQASIQSTVVCPSGFFSDMNDFLEMAKGGRVYLFGDGHYRINPIHGADLAMATADAIEQGRSHVDVGGPDIFTHTELATLALQVMKKPVRITYMWDGIRKLIACLLPWVTPITIYGPAQFFLSAFGMDMIGETVGTHHLEKFWTEQLLSKEEEQNKK